MNLMLAAASDIIFEARSSVSLQQLRICKQKVTQFWNMNLMLSAASEIIFEAGSCEFGSDTRVSCLLGDAYIYRVLKQVHLDTSISSKAISVGSPPHVANHRMDPEMLDKNIKHMCQVTTGELGEMDELWQT
ncbi:unnamed protein product [Thelazia callipaeda]|uniref:Myosin motor domain-containing protein n=1 Tax=Thelazia callipaeda TaxID=103827 RepID=A0A0N5CTU2_THECL|nr:unnamed protein product [Thelazia callipaeda]